MTMRRPVSPSSSGDPPRRIARAINRFCAEALPHLEMAVIYLLAVIVMETAPIIGPMHLAIR